MGGPNKRDTPLRERMESVATGIALMAVMASPPHLEHVSANGELIVAVTQATPTAGRSTARYGRAAATPSRRPR
jgi:hypothetical protein